MNVLRVFISSTIEDLEIARALQHQLAGSAEVNLWSERIFNLGKTTVESLTEIADQSDFAIFIVTGDDNIPVSPRSNLMFELGFFAGRLGLSRIFIIIRESTRLSLPADLGGALFMSLPIRIMNNVDVAIAPVATTIRQAIARIGPIPEIRQHSAIEYYSCFISYSWADKDFAFRLQDDLKDAGVRCWLDAKDMRIGDQVDAQIKRAIQQHDKLLLVLSEASVRSSWVSLELQYALELEDSRRKTVLFPLRLDDSVFKIVNIQEFDRLKQKHIVDFRDWKDLSQYRRSFSGLVRDLAISNSVDAGRSS